MRYIDESLAPGETIIQRGKWPAIFWVGAWAALIVLGIAIVGIFIFVRAAIVMSTTDFAVTNKRVVIKRGWLRRRTAELAVQSVEGVSLDQSLVARLFGFGRVIVTGTGDATLVFPTMANPVAFRRAIETARAQAGQRTANQVRDGVEAALGATREEDVVAEEEDVVAEKAPPAAPRQRRTRSRRFIGLGAR